MRTMSSVFGVHRDEEHRLLEPPSPAYTNVTVRRAFIVWMHCGQQNKFKDVCNYYHYLESLEDKLPADRRASSRHHEFNMFTNPPPTSDFLNQIYPKLYSQTNTIQQYIKKVEAIRNNACVFKLEGFHEMKPKTITADIVDASQMIRKYCKSHMKPLRRFLMEFKEHTQRCNINNTVVNVTFYIKRKLIEEELQMIANYPRTFSFLTKDDDSDADVKRQNEIRIVNREGVDADARNDFGTDCINDLRIKYMDMTLRNVECK